MADVPHLLQLHEDAPLSWDEVRARVAAHYDRYDRYGTLLAVPVERKAVA